MENTKQITIHTVEDAFKKGYLAISASYGTGKVYTFVRKRYEVANSTNYNFFFIIDGFKTIVAKVAGTTTYNVLSTEKEYETEGHIKLNTSKKASDKIKELVKDTKSEVKKIDYIPGSLVKHNKYDLIKDCIELKIPVFLAGPAGSGKNHTIEQIAEELGYDFYFSNSIQQEYKLTGFIDAHGTYHNTEFYKAATSDTKSIFFLDEIDASIPEVLVLLNMAIANGYFEFPTGRVELKNIHFIAAGNTVGNGADEQYTGRMVIDQATLDRFAIIDFDYDVEIERSITKGNMELVSFVRNLRAKAKEQGVRTTFSYRCLIMTTKLETTQIELKDILAITVFKGLDKDTISTLYGYSDLPGNRYQKAFYKLKTA